MKKWGSDCDLGSLRIHELASGISLVSPDCLKASRKACRFTFFEAVRSCLDSNYHRNHTPRPHCANANAILSL